jgi:3-oxoacyl-[acyl-carrier protein] reductase
MRGADSRHLGPKAFDLLELLLSHRPKVVAKQRIRDHLWPDTFVSYSTVATLVTYLLPAPAGHRWRCIGGAGRRTPGQRRPWQGRAHGMMPWTQGMPHRRGWVPMQDFAGRVAIVTGAARGLGRAAASRLHERGAAVAVNVRDPERALAVVQAMGERGLAVPGDVAAPGVPDEIVRATLERFGRVDILVNNAALARSTRFPELSAEEWRQALEVNLTAPFLLTKAVLPTMKAQGYGRIVNISSSAGRTVSTLGGAHYTASKAGLLGLTRAAAKELGPFGITVNAVCPGMIDTELTREHATPDLLTRLAAGYPVPRLGTALEVADLICFAASEAAGYMTGVSFDINGGDLMM